MAHGQKYGRGGPKRKHFCRFLAKRAEHAVTQRNLHPIGLHWNHRNRNTFKNFRIYVDSECLPWIQIRIYDIWALCNRKHIWDYNVYKYNFIQKYCFEIPKWKFLILYRKHNTDLYRTILRAIFMNEQWTCAAGRRTRRARVLIYEAPQSAIRIRRGFRGGSL